MTGLAGGDGTSPVTGGLPGTASAGGTGGANGGASGSTDGTAAGTSGNGGVGGNTGSGQCCSGGGGGGGYFGGGGGGGGDNTRGGGGGGGGSGFGPAGATFSTGVQSADGYVAFDYIPTVITTPTQSSPGGTVTISGNSCEQNGPPGSIFNGTVTGSVAFSPALAFGPITAAADGTWSTQIVVPAGTPAGTYPVTATCSYTAIASASVGAQATASYAYDPGAIIIAIVAKFTG